MRPKAGRKLRNKLQHTHGVLMYPSMCDGVQMFKELKDELANIHDAYDSNEHERKIKLMRDEVLRPRQLLGAGLRRQGQRTYTRPHSTPTFGCSTSARGLDDSSSTSCRQHWQARDAHFYAN
eukprot:3732213-Pleurochrysis_carterae.AAC.1